MPEKSDAAAVIQVQNWKNKQTNKSLSYYFIMRIL